MWERWLESTRREASSHVRGRAASRAMARRIATTLAAAPFENVIKVLPHETRSPSSSSRIPATTRLPAPPPKVHQRQRPSEFFLDGHRTVVRKARDCHPASAR